MQIDEVQIDFSADGAASFKTVFHACEMSVDGDSVNHLPAVCQSSRARFTLRWLAPS